MARSARRNYVRDGRGRFASTPGGGAAKKPRTTFRQRQAVSLARQRKQTGRLGSATREAKARLAASRKKLTPNASPQQKAAVTRAKRMAAALAGERRIKTSAQAGVLRGAAARGVKKAEGARVRNVRGDGMSKGRPGQLARALARAEANRQRLGAAKEPSRKKEDGYAVNTEAAALYSGRRRSGSRAANSMPVSLSFDAGKKVVARRMAALRGGPAATAKPTPKGVLRGRPRPVDATPMGGRVPASQRPGSITSTLRGTLQALAKADAARIREIEGITGRPVRAPRKPAAGTGATVRAPGRRSVSGTLGDNLRSLAQSDARTAREMADLAKPTPKGALKGGKGGSRKRVKGGEGAPKALPPTPAKPVTRGKAAPAGAPAAPVKKPARGGSGSRRESKRNISDAKAARIIARIDANRPGLRRASGSDRRTRNALQTHDRASAFVLAASGRARRRGTPIDLAESVRRAVRNAKPKPAPAKPKPTRTVYRTRQQAARRQRRQSNALGRSLAASRGFASAVAMGQSFADSAPRRVFSRRRVAQATIWGGVERVGAGPLRQIGERTSSGSVRRTRPTTRPLPGSPRYRRELQRLVTANGGKDVAAFRF